MLSTAKEFFTSQFLKQDQASLEKIQRDLVAQTETLTFEREQLRTVMGSISDAIIAIDSSENIQFYNGQFVVMLGSTITQPMDRLTLIDLFRDPEILMVFRIALQEGRPASLKAKPFHDGRHYYSLSVSPVRGSADRPVSAAIGIFHDVTELKTAEQMRIDFVANVSHELRTPLTAIKGYSDLLKQEYNVNYLNVIDRNVQRLMSLIQDLLDLSQIDAGKDTLHKEKIDLHELTERAQSQIQALMEQKHQTLEIEYLTDSLFADPQRLEQILVNLLENAHKYTPDFGHIKVSWEESLKRQDILLKVKDSGPGIAKEHQSKLFDRFYRINEGRSTSATHGTGLGLAIVKHIMQRHGGAVWVESEVGQGSQFVCQFPK
jgi:two-component system phosphate regulon sensor histidine kinase PhoR